MLACVLLSTADVERWLIITEVNKNAASDIQFEKEAI
jgi:hypothetical protein